ncbi:MAG TPA: flippase [Candidatus Limnocylindrales bacterium]|nr:flippase [Candidatus Limnocylindrales bacterium]
MGPREGDPEPALPASDPRNDVADGSDATKSGRRETRRQLRGSSVLLVGRVLSVVLNLVTQVAIVRYLSTSDYGAFAYALATVALVGGLLGLGFDRAISRFLPIYDEQADHARFLGTAGLVVGIILGLGGAVILLVVGLQATLLGHLIDDPLAILIVVIMIFLAPIEALDGVLTDFFAVFSSARTIFVRRYILAPSLRLTVVILLILTGRDVVFLAAGYVIAGGVGILLYLTLVPGILRQAGVMDDLRARRIDIPFREIVSYTFPLLTMDIVLLSISSFDALLVGNVHGTTEVAELRVVDSTARLNSIVFQTFSILFIPTAARFFARNDRAAMGDMYWRTAAWMAVLSFPVFALTFSLAQPITILLFGERYASSAVILALVSTARYIDAAFGANGATIRIFGGIKEIVVVNLATAVFHVTLALILVPPFGAVGAAVSILVTYIFYNALKQIVLRRVSGVPVFDMRYVSTYIAIVVTAVAMALIVVVFDPPLIVSLAVAGLGSLAVLAFGRSSLRIGETFPELLRFPGGRFLG